MTQLLLDNAVPIEQSNCIRSHLSQIKGGKYLQHIAPATSLSVILSDVRYDNLQIIASGLTEPTHCDRARAAQILREYNIWQRTPARIRQLLSAGHAHADSGSPPHARPRPHAINRNFVIGNTYRALTAAADSAAELGYTPTIVTDCLFGEAAAAAAHIAAVCAFHLRLPTATRPQTLHPVRRRNHRHHPRHRHRRAQPGVSRRVPQNRHRGQRTARQHPTASR